VTSPIMLGYAQAAQIGASRAMSAASDRHAARLVFQNPSVLIAEYLCLSSVG
jgi:hypothetical protein